MAADNLKDWENTWDRNFFEGGGGASQPEGWLSFPGYGSGRT